MICGMTVRFLLLWIAYWLIFLLQPVESIYSHTELAFLVQFLFVASVVLSSAISYTGARRVATVRHNNSQTYYSITAKRVVTIGCILSLIGTALLLIDKVFIQDIDYTSGIAVAREQWRLVGLEREGVPSSFYSAIGYLVGSSYYLSLALLFSRALDIGDRWRFGFLMIASALILANSLITGGRSAVLLAAAFVSYSYFSKVGRVRKNLFDALKYRIALMLLMAVFCGYVLYVFSARADAGGQDVASYSLGFLEYLGLRPAGWFEHVAKDSLLGQFVALFNLALAYLTHSFATMTAIVNFDGDSQVVLFGHIQSLFSKVGLAEAPSQSWFLAGRFPSLPGAVYLQFGILGVFIGASLIGVVSGYIAAWHQNRQQSIPAIFACCCLEAVLLFSPFLFAGDALFYPFLVGGGIAVILIVTVTRKRFWQ